MAGTCDSFSHERRILLDWRASQDRAILQYDRNLLAGGRGVRSTPPNGGKTVRRLQLIVAVFVLFSMGIAASTLAYAEGASGEATFKAKCVLCHGADGAGNTTLGKQLQAANLGSKEVQKKTDAEIRKTVHDGNGNMPPFGEQLSDDEITQVIKYVRHFGKVAKK